MIGLIRLRIEIFSDGPHIINMSTVLRVNWLGHMKRRGEGIQLQIIYRGSIRGRRSRGIPRKTFLEDM